MAMKSFQWWITREDLMATRVFIFNFFGRFDSHTIILTLDCKGGHGGHEVNSTLDCKRPIDVKFERFTI
jgi:hypothetical protein